MSGRWSTSCRVGSVEDAVEKQGTTVTLEGSFRSLFVAMKVIGVWPVRSASRFLRAAHRVYGVTMVLLFAYVFCTRLGAFSIAANYTVMLATIQLWWMETLVIVVHFMVAATWDSQLPRCYRQLEAYLASCQEDSSRRRFARRMTVGLWSFVATATGLFVASMTTQFYAGDEQTLSLATVWSYPFSVNSTVAVAVQGAVSMAATFYGFEAWLFVLVHFILVCAVLSHELQLINERLSSDIHADGSVADGVIETMRRRHERVCSLIANADRVLGVYVAVLFVSFIPVFCIVLEDTVFSDMGLGLRLSFCQWWLMQAVVVAGMATFAVRLSNQAHETSTYLYMIDTSQLDPKQIHPLTMFLLRQNGAPIGVSAGGMMTITKDTLLAFVGTVITYVVFVVEIHRK